jgi:alpha-glucosidase
LFLVDSVDIGKSPAPKDVVAHYTMLTGHMPMPPRWALGYQQSRYNYYPESKVRGIASNFRTRGIPADGIWLDIDYLDAYKPFTWDRSRFPDPGRMISDLGKEGFHAVTIVDPHPKKEPGYEPYDSGLAGDHFVRRQDGSVYANVWPSRAPLERDRGPSVFPEFNRPATRNWWGTLYASLMNIGVSGIWNDMNEPAVFETPTGTMPRDARHDNEGQPANHAEMFTACSCPRPLTRDSFVCGPTNVRSYSPALRSPAASVTPPCGREIRLAIGHSCDPFMRAHSNKGTPEREPWSYGPRYEFVIRKAIELRYELLPEIYNVMHQASEAGLPALRPLVLEFPDDPGSVSRDDEFPFGSDLLIAPVLQEGAQGGGSLSAAWPLARFLVRQNIWPAGERRL